MTPPIRTVRREISISQNSDMQRMIRESGSFLTEVTSVKRTSMLRRNCCTEEIIAFLEGKNVGDDEG